MVVAASVPLLELRGVSKHFGAVQALTDIQFDVHAHEVVALVGDNGAGKSTLVKLISGIYAADSGSFLWEGREVTISGPGDAAALGISTVYQDLALCDNLDVVANLYLGREAGGGGALGRIDEVTMETRSIEVLRRLSVKIPSVRIPIASLSGGQRQSVAVARSVLWDNKVVLLDEPTAALGVAQTHEVLELVKRLRDEGQGVVIISHNLADVFEVADRITVLRLGRYVGTYDAKRVGREQLVGLMTGAVPGIADDDDIDPTAAPGTLGAIVVPVTAPAVATLPDDTPEFPPGPPTVPPAAAPPPTGPSGSTGEDVR
jgi:D-xylose transport system ATP-binding protein